MTVKDGYKNRRFIALVVAILLFVNAMTVAFVDYALSEVKQRDIARSEMQAGALVQAIRQNLDNTIGKIEIALKILADYLTLNAANFDEENIYTLEIMSNIRYLIGESEAVSATDKFGKVRFHLGRANRKNLNLNVSDREYFQKLKQVNNDFVYVTRSIKSRITGRDILIFSKSYRDSSGNFAGVAVIPIGLDYLRSQISGFPLKEDSFLSLRGDDFSLIARVPETSRGIVIATGDQAYVPSSLPQLVATGLDKGAFIALTPKENIERLYAFARLSSCPIYVINGFSLDAALEEWRHLRDGSIITASVFIFLINFSALMMLYYWLKERRNAAQLHDSNGKLQNAVQSLQQLHKSILAACEVGRLGTFALDLNDDSWSRSPEQEAIFGIDRHYPATGAAWSGLILDSDRSALATYLKEQVLRRGQTLDREYRIKRPSDGATRWIHGVGKVEFSPAGVPLRLIGAVKDVTEQKESQARMAYLAYHDSLTGLPNRSLLGERMHQALNQAQNHKDLLAVCHLDLDGFKAINDQWGHEVGDRMLVEVAERLLRVIRSGDTVARMGGDEFVVLLCQLRAESDLDDIARRMMAAIAQPYTCDGQSARLSVSIGFTIYPRDPAEEPDALIRHADQALHEAKRTGKNCLCGFDPVSARRQQERQSHCRRLVVALEQGEFCFHYQPKIDLKSGSVAGVEALIRWQHPQRGLLLPGSFLPGVEKTDFTIPLGDWVLRQALRQLRAWQQEGLKLTIGVNVFGHHLQQPDFVARLVAILEEFPDVSPGDLQMEILETTAMDDLEAVSQRISDCTRLGISFALDDFGTGYSSLNYFRRLPVKFLKIDRSFVFDLIKNPKDQALVESMVRMAHALDRQVIAEGVESLAHGVPLVRYGCDLAQGYGIAHPMPASEIPAWVRSWRMPSLWCPSDIITI